VRSPSPSPDLWPGPVRWPSEQQRRIAGRVRVSPKVQYLDSVHAPDRPVEDGRQPAAPETEGCQPKASQPEAPEREACQPKALKRVACRERESAQRAKTETPVSRRRSSAVRAEKA
jgi:hypothetical protein